MGCQGSQSRGMGVAGRGICPLPQRKLKQNSAFMFSILLCHNLGFRTNQDLERKWTNGVQLKQRAVYVSTSPHYFIDTSNVAQQHPRLSLMSKVHHPWAPFHEPMGIHKKYEGWLCMLSLLSSINEKYTQRAKPCQPNICILHNYVPCTVTSLRRMKDERFIY